MKWIISLLLCLSINCFGQNIKHVELISEIQDSMALISKPDIDSINVVFHKYVILDSLDGVNEKLIMELEEKNANLDSILLEQRAIIVNDSIIRCQEQLANEHTIEIYRKEIRKESNKKIFYQSTTGMGVLIIILILLL